MNNQNHHPKQREIWLFDPDPVVGGELGFKKRPALIISNNAINQGPSKMVIIVPCTTKDKSIPSHIRIYPKNSGLESISFAVCEQLRSVSKVRLIKKYGTIDHNTMKQVLEWIHDFTRLEL